MNWELDHLFFATSEPETLARELVELVSNLSEPVIFVSTWPRPLGGLEWFVKSSLVSLSDGSGYFLELEWDQGRQGEIHDLSAAPIRIRW